MTYGILASGSCLLTDIVDQLHENSKKVISVERLTRHLNKGIEDAELQSYLNAIRKWISEDPVVHIDDSDVVKPYGYKFEASGALDIPEFFAIYHDHRLSRWFICLLKLRFFYTKNFAIINRALPYTRKGVWIFNFHTP